MNENEQSYNVIVELVRRKEIMFRARIQSLVIIRNQLL